MSEYSWYVYILRRVPLPAGAPLGSVIYRQVCLQKPVQPFERESPPLLFRIPEYQSVGRPTGSSFFAHTSPIAHLPPPYRLITPRNIWSHGVHLEGRCESESREITGWDVCYVRAGDSEDNERIDIAQRPGEVPCQLRLREVKGGC